MTRLIRRLFGGVLLVSALALLWVLGPMGGAVGTDSEVPPVLGVNRIAVVGLDGQIRSYRPNGTGARPVSEGEGYFTWPTWAPNGKSIVYSGVVSSASGQPTVALFQYDGATRLSRTIYQGAPGFTGLLANGVPHYPLWSPDSSKLAFVAATQTDGLTLFLNSVDTRSDPESVLNRGPLWMSWSGDSTQLLVHRGRDHFVVDIQDQVVLQRIGLISGAYRVPAWRPNSNELTLLHSVGGSVFGLYSAPITPRGLVLSRSILPTGSDPAFLWSPSGSHIAVADDVRLFRYSTSVMLVYRQLRVLSENAYAERALVRSNVLSYFWSPDSTKIAYVSLVDQQGRLRWSILDVATGNTVDLVDFRPSPDQLTMFQYFDQYAYSHQLWSSDSRFLIFSGSLDTGATTAGFNSGAADRHSRVYIIDTGGAGLVDSIADGVLGFWSPA